MADIYGSHFEYGGVDSATHGMIIANVETERFTQVAGTISGVTIFNKKNKKNYLIDDDYSESPVSFEVDIVTDDDRPLTRSEQREIENWLFNRHNYKKLYVDDAVGCINKSTAMLSYYKMKISGSVDGVSNISLSVVDNDPTATLRVSFTLSGSSSSYNFNVNGRAVAITSTSDVYTLPISNIYPDAYDKPNTVIIAKGNEEMTIKCSVLSCIGDILSSAESTAQQKSTANELFQRHASMGSSEYVNGSLKRMYLNCRFINPYRLEYMSGTVGYRVTLEADSGYWWQDPVTYTFALNHTVDGDRTRIIVPVDSDIDDYTYPTVTITMAQAGETVNIINNTDSDTRQTIFTNLSGGSHIVLKGDINYVSGQFYAKFYQQNFPRLLNGNNSIDVVGGISSISFTFNNRRNL